MTETPPLIPVLWRFSSPLHVVDRCTECWCCCALSYIDVVLVAWPSPVISDDFILMLWVFRETAASCQRATQSAPTFLLSLSVFTQRRNIWQPNWRTSDPTSGPAITSCFVVYFKKSILEIKIHLTNCNYVSGELQKHNCASVVFGSHISVSPLDTSSKSQFLASPSRYRHDKRGAKEIISYVFLTKTPHNSQQ